MSTQKTPATGHVPLRTILATYFRFGKRYPLSGIFVFVLYGIGILFQEVILRLPFRDLIDLITATKPSPALWTPILHLLLVIIGIEIFFNVCFRGADFCIVYLEANVLRDLANYALQGLQRHSYHFFAGNFTGGLVAKVKRFVRSFESLFDKIIFDFWFIGVQLVGVLVVLAYEMPPLAAFFGLWCVCYFIMSYVFMRYRLKYDFLEAEADSAVTGQLSDIITNILNLKVFTSSEREMRRFGETTHGEYKARMNVWLRSNLFFGIQAIAMGILEVLGMTIAARMWLAGTISAGSVVLVQSYFAMIMFKAWGLGRAMGDVFKALSEGEEMINILRSPLEVNDPALPEPSRMARGTIAFQNVAFRYKKGKDVFQDFSLVIPSGQKVGIVGHSGAGKSTLMKLLLRFADITSGSITIDGQDIRAVMQDDLRKRLSYVPQDPILFHRSLYDNIAYAKPEATQEEIFEAARRAHAHDFISNLSKGYETFVGERGIKLSGGERQRIAIARAILKNAPILLLDEATSSLDSVSEQFIQEQLAELMKGKTTLAIAHRISTIRQMDRIVVVSEGKVAEDGTHEELLERKGIYAELWEHQSAGFLMEEPRDTEESMEIEEETPMNSVTGE